MSTLERRLTTILAADVAGYSRMMEADERGTHAALSAHLNEHVLPSIDAGHGHVVKLMGDGLLVEFDSVVDAVECAIALQKGMAERNSDLPEDKRIELRIGVHLGDVISEEGDIFGDGVNVAARLEALADAGAICVSQQVLDQIETKVRVTRHDLGQCKVKNLSRTIHVHQLDPIGQSEGHKKPPKRFRALLIAAVLVGVGGLSLAIWQPWNWRTADLHEQAERRNTAMLPSLAVLPFDNLSGSSEDDYLVDGMTDDLTTDLARLSGLVVIARTSTLPYKGQSPNVGEVAKELGARYVVFGTMRRLGNTLRINAKLVDSETSALVWAQRFDNETKNLLVLQDEVRGKIVSALKVQFRPEEVQGISRSKTDNPDAYDAYLRARQQESYFTADSTREAIRLYHKALEHDPDFVLATARLAIAYTLAVDNGWVADTKEGLELARSLSAQAVAKDPSLPVAYWAVARYFTRDETWDTDKAIGALEKAIEIDPNYADGYAMLANTLQFVGRSEEGLGYIETAMRLNPNFPFWYYFALGTNQFHLTHYEAALNSFENAIERNPGWPPSYRYLISTLGHLGKLDEAEWQMEELKVLGTHLSLAEMEARTKTQDAVYRKRFFDGLKKAGVPEN